MKRALMSFPLPSLKPLALLLALALALPAGGTSAATGGIIKVNQLGFAPAASTIAVVPESTGSGFEVVRADTGATVLRGQLSKPALWAPSAETVRLADFSSLATPGKYRLKVAGAPVSDPFTVGPDAYNALNAASIKALYYNRASIELPAKYAGVFARPAGHPDDKVLVHASAASKARPEGTVLSSPKGWYDAGDYNKYIVNSGISTYTLLAAYEHFPEYFNKQNLAIPESGNGLPDILSEVLWNLEWMLTMQDPNDGGVYHKLTNKRFDGFVMPDKTDAGTRYVVAKSTAAALDYAATMAAAARVLKPFDKQRPGMSTKMLASAESAWKWAQANPALLFKNPADISTGEYGDGKVDDEFAWAAAELYISTGKDSYYTAMKADSVKNGVPGWSDVHGLPWMSLAHHLRHLSPVADRKLIASRIDTLAARLTGEWKSSAYKVAMAQPDFVWGSNAVVMNQAMMLIQAYRLNGQREYLDAAQSGLDYVLGRNAVGYSFVTGVGARPPLYPHHRPTEADKVAAPVPGFLVGGPQAGRQDQGDCKVQYPGKLAATAYLDHMCSYASNEVAINWNAPLTYVSAALDVLTAKATTGGAAGNTPAAGNSAAGATKAGGTKMNEANVVPLETLKRQEQELQFTQFTNDMALEIGNRIVENAKARKQNVTVDITRNGQKLFFHAMTGTTNDNVEWIRRKNNLVNRTGHSSFYVHTDVKSKGGDIDAMPLYDIREYAAHGGAFPIILKGSGMIGTITVSGLPGVEDHASVVRVLKSYLNANVDV